MKCEHDWISKNGIDICSICNSLKMHQSNGKSWIENAMEKNKEFIDNIKNNPWERKVFNFIKNDLTGIINSFNDERITFEYNGLFESNSFLEKFTNILKNNNFKEVQYNKKNLKFELLELFNEFHYNEEFISSKRVHSLPGFLDLNDREMKLFVHIIMNYD